MKPGNLSATTGRLLILFITVTVLTRLNAVAVTSTNALEVTQGTLDGEYVYTWSYNTFVFVVAGFEETATRALAELVSLGGYTPLTPSPPTPSAPPIPSHLSIILTVDGVIQTEDPWTTGDTNVNEWAKPMYYITLDDNGDPTDGAYGNGLGPSSCMIWLDTGQLGFQWIGPDYQWNTGDDLRYFPLHEMEPGWWSENGIEAKILTTNRLNVTVPLQLMGTPSSLDVSCMTSPWTTTALDNLGPGAYATPAWTVIANTTIPETYTIADSEGDTHTWPSELNPPSAENFDIIALSLSLITTAPIPTPTIPQDGISPSEFLPETDLPIGVTLEGRIVTGKEFFSFPVAAILTDNVEAAAMGFYRMDATDDMIRVLVLKCSSEAGVAALSPFTTSILEDFDTHTTTFTQKASATLTCTPSSMEIEAGETLTISGAITPWMSGTTVTLIYQSPDSTRINRTVTTDPTGHYQDNYVPTTLGAWTVQATCRGNATVTDATSSAQSFKVIEPMGGPLQLPWYLFVVAGIVGGVSVLTYYTRSRQAGASPKRTKPMCAHCRTPLPHGATFCPECGQAS